MQSTRRNQAVASSHTETLESRLFLSGDVLATAAHGNLAIKGDPAANAIVVDQVGLSADEVRVTGAGGTTINGQADPVILSGVTRGVVARMGDAADSVTLHDLNLPGNVSLDGRGGANTFTIANVHVAMSLTIKNGTTLSATTVTDSTVGKNLTITAGTGGQNVTVQSVDVTRNTRVSGGKAASLVTADESAFHGAVRIATGQAADAIRIDSRGGAFGSPSQFGGPVVISSSGGDDTLQVGLVGHRPAFAGKVSLDGGTGNDTLRNFDPGTYTGKQFKVKKFETSTQDSDSTAPSVTATDPADGATGVARNRKFSASFSEAMDPATITAATVMVSAPGQVSVPGTVGYVGTTMTFTPAAPLAADTTYTVTITTGAKDAGGNPIAANFVAAFTTGATSDTTAPDVSSTSPADAQTDVFNNKTVAATFGESMDPLTITAANFRLTGPGGAPVTGTVTYDASSRIAALRPASDLAPNTTYTSRISGGANGAKDLAGNPLASDKVWTFTTGTQSAQAPINLGAAGAFAVMATASISSTSATQINGDVGLNPGSAQGIPPAQVNGTIHVTDASIIQAQSDLAAAYNDAVGRATSPVSLPGNMGGLTFTPGLYTNSTSVLIQGSGPGNNVTLDAQGDPDAIFIFQMGSTLTTGPGAQVILAGGAKASNVFWQVGTSATLDTTTIFKGNIMAAVTITVNNGSSVDGRLLAGSNSDGSVTINGSTITVPAA
jgi:hypothetical protein